MIVLKYGSSTHRGQVRANNQDSFYAGRLENKNSLYFLAVADGIGGYLGGDTASKMAIQLSVEWIEEKLAEDYQDDLLFWPQALKELAFYLNEKILDAASQDIRFDSMGTTLTAVLEKDRLLFMLHIGDSRFYHYNGENLFQISGDHSWAGELLRSGKISKEEAKTHPNRNILIQSLGYDAKLAPELKILELTHDSVLLLCSDGLYNLVEDSELITYLANMEDPQETAQELVDLANSRGGEDNITVVLAKYVEVGEQA